MYWGKNMLVTVPLLKTVPTSDVAWGVSVLCRSERASQIDHLGLVQQNIPDAILNKRHLWYMKYCGQRENNVDKKTFWWICWTEKNVSNGIQRWRHLKGGLLSKHRKIFSTPGQNNPRWEYLWAACVVVSECLFLTTKMNIASMHYGNIFEDNSPVYKTGE